MRKRYQTKASHNYLYKDQELKRCEDIVDIFRKFDTDKSGSIELDELFEMFRSNDIRVTKPQIRQLFRVVDKNGSGDLSIEEFKRMILQE